MNAKQGDAADISRQYPYPNSEQSKTKAKDESNVPDEMPRRRTQAPRSRPKDCCAQLYEALKDIPGFNQRALHKPKTPNKVKVSYLCDAWPAKDAMAPIFFHFVERYQTKKPAVDEAEKEIFSYFDSVPREGMSALTESLDAYKRLPAAERSCLFRKEFVDLSVDQAIDLDTIADVWMRQGTVFAQDQLYSHAGSAAGQVRPWAFPIIRALDTPAPPVDVTAPWPFICAVNGLRKADHRPRLRRYQPEELEQRCSYDLDEETGEVSERCRYRRPPDCTGGSHGDLCLRVPSARAGRGVELTGFNFFSRDCKVRLTHREQRSITYTLDARVRGDARTPLADDEGRTIADCRVEDRISFRLPETSPDGFHDFVPGIYTVDVIVPNDIEYTLASGDVPSEFSTAQVRNTALLDILPSDDLRYRIWMNRIHSYDDTDSREGSDEIGIRAAVARFGLSGDEPRVSLRMADTPVFGDFDVGETRRFETNLIGDPGDPDPVTGTLAISLVGFEIDSEDAWRDRLRSWSEAFRGFIERLWDLIKDKIGAIAGGLAKLGFPWGLIAGAIAVVVITIIGVIWAIWAPPDLMLLDLIVLSEDDLFFLTYPSAPMLGLGARLIEDVFILRVPENKVGYLYTEERRYLSLSSESTYGLWFAYRREA